MKRSGPLRRRTGLQNRAKKPLRRRGALNPMSPKRRGQIDRRALVCAEVVARDGGRCAGWGIRGVPHDHRDPTLLPDAVEVHELRRGKMRCSDWLDPDWCIPLCAAAHRWATVDGYPEPARTVGLAMASWEPDPAIAERRRRSAQQPTTPGEPRG